MIKPFQLLMNRRLLQSVWASFAAMLLAFEAAGASSLEGSFAPDSGNLAIPTQSGSVVLEGLTNLTLSGPAGPLGGEVTSEDSITYTSLLPGGTLGFHGSPDAGNGLGGSANFVYGPDNTLEFLAGGDFFGVLQAGDPFSFVLDPDVIKGKGSTPMFMITEFNFTPIPEPSVLSLGAVLALSWCGYARMRRRRGPVASASER